jgi:hypothetical protein
MKGRKKLAHIFLFPENWYILVDSMAAVGLLILLTSLDIGPNIIPLSRVLACLFLWLEVIVYIFYPTVMYFSSFYISLDRYNHPFLLPLGMALSIWWNRKGASRKRWENFGSNRCCSAWFLMICVACWCRQGERWLQRSGERNGAKLEQWVNDGCRRATSSRYELVYGALTAVGGQLSPTSNQQQVRARVVLECWWLQNYSKHLVRGL